jgi:GNAT superfamily N-acetyltransferase
VWKEGLRVIRVRAMTAADLPLGMRLKQQAGWNQTEADWRRFLDLEPDGCFVAELDGRPVGTSTTCVFGPVAWVAMVLVEETVRGRGVGTALTAHALAFLDGRGVRSVRLDATPLGRPVYENLGFVAEYQLARSEGTLPGGPEVPGVEPARPEDLNELFDLDRAVTATDRRNMLARLFRERPESVRVVRRGGRVEGFLTARPGSRALMLGPCLASAEAGPLLFADACRRYAGKYVYIDIPLANSAAVALAGAAGLGVQRHLLRMGRGPTVRERLAELWASSGPEKG